MDMKVVKYTGMKTQSIVESGPTGMKEGRLHITEPKQMSSKYEARQDIVLILKFKHLG